MGGVARKVREGPSGGRGTWGLVGPGEPLEQFEWREKVVYVWRGD